jgi:hypothetical protein
VRLVGLQHRADTAGKHNTRGQRGGRVARVSGLLPLDRARGGCEGMQTRFLFARYPAWVALDYGDSKPNNCGS